VVSSLTTLCPKELPEVVFPQIYVSTPYPRVPHLKDIETESKKHLEKQDEIADWCEKMTSNSVQDFSNVIIEFQTECFLYQMLNAM